MQIPSSNRGRKTLAHFIISLLICVKSRLAAGLTKSGDHAHFYYRGEFAELQAAKLDFIQLRGIANRINKAFEQCVRNFYHVGLLW
jgi:hypothetical protein